MASKEQKSKDKKKEKVSKTLKQTTTVVSATTDTKTVAKSGSTDKNVDKSKASKPKDAHSSPSLVKRCVCKYPYQDEMYGEQMRVCNPQKAATGVVYKCTVCGVIVK